LAVSNFFLRFSIFYLATLKYFSSFSLFLPLLLPFGASATFTDDVPPSDTESASFAFDGTFKVLLLFLAGVALVIALTSRFLVATCVAAAATFVSGTICYC